ncbi:MAG: glycoside hydrolase family 130 protein [Acidimicrobiales bacterium]
MTTQLRRFEGNPILQPVAASPWQTRAAFNPGALSRDGVVHLLYRAAGSGDGYVSRLGYATSVDGLHFERASADPVLTPGEPYDSGAIEDPRIVSIDGQVYVTYVAVGVPALTPGKLSHTALARTPDFRHYERLGLISPRTDIDDRDTVLLPERVGGRYVMLHRPQQIQPDGTYQEWGTGRPSSIWVSFSESLTEWDMGSPLLRPEQPWEAAKIGAGPPPLWTERGWLVLYHGVDADSVYRAGAALLDLDDPSQVTGRLAYPVLEPQESYEMVGDHRAVVFPQGAVVLDGDLFVYYGGADSVCAVATVELDELLAALVA